MNNKKSRSIRQLLDLPRLPKDMDTKQRRLYRRVKKEYCKLSKNTEIREKFLDNLAAVARLIAQQEKTH